MTSNDCPKRGALTGRKMTAKLAICLIISLKNGCYLLHPIKGNFLKGSVVSESPLPWADSRS